MPPNSSAPVAAVSPAAPVEPEAAAAQAQHSFHGVPIRSIPTDGGALFVASDLCRALRLPLGGTGSVTPAKYIRNIDASHKSYRSVMTRQGPQLCAVLTAAGALDLATPPRRKREVDRQFRLWLEDSLSTPSNSEIPS
jgi:prophage antirepressor-like protein